MVHHHPNDPRTVRDLVDAQAVRRGRAPYLIDDESGRTIDFAALQASCRAVEQRIEACGVPRGETVAVVMPNGVATVSLLLGTMYAGRCVVPVNLLSQPEQMRYVLDHAGSTLVFASPPWASKLREWFADRKPPRIVEVEPDADRLPSCNESRVAPHEEPVSANDLALLMYTSGTTGKPKGVMLSHGNLAANAHAISREHSLEPEDRVAAVLPLYHINGFAVTLLAPLAHGGSLALAARFSTGRFWHLVAERGCTWINLVPTMISYLLEGGVAPPDARRRLRFCRSASAALPPDHHRAFEAKFGIGIIETMGLTETVAPAFSNPLDPARRRIGSVGRPSGCEARVVDENGQPVPDGQSGEIVVRGPQITSGYYHDPQATRAAFLDGDWLRTGDLGRRDADGFFYITGRIKELIIKGGENIAPREIDEVLLRHPAVADAAAVGIPDRHYGQEIMACVIVRPDRRCEGQAEQESLREELRRFCTAQLGPYKTPKLIRFVDELPRGPSGKVQRLKLLDPPAR